MKFFSAILVAVFCATVASAAPSSSQKLSFQDLALNDYSGIVDKLKEHGIDVMCIRNVVGKVVGDSELKGAWIETKTKLDKLINQEWQKCMQLEDSKQHECMVVVVEKGALVVGEFIKKLDNESQWPLLKEIKDKVMAECFENGTVGDEMKQKFRQKVKCVIEAITTAVKDTEFAPVWEEYVKHLANLHERVKICTEKPSSVEVARCIVNELKHDEEIRRKFFENLKKVDKESFLVVAKHVKGKCFEEI